jgi:Helix-turn-helix domain
VLLELSVVEQRYNAVMEVLRDGHMVIEVAERYGVSRQAVHRWLRRYQQGGLDALADRSHRPRRCPHQLAAVVEARLASCAGPIPAGGHGGWATSWPASRSPRCRHGPRSTGCWSATA